VFVLLLQAAQAAGAVVLALLFSGFRTQYHRDYLHHWSRSFWAMAVYLIGSALAVFTAFLPGQNPVLRVVLAALYLSAAYLQVAWLLVGTWEMARGRSFDGERLKRWLLIAVGIGVTSALLFAFDPDASRERVVVRVGLRYLVTGVAFLGVAWLLWKSGTLRTGIGPRLLTGAFLLYGLELTHVFVVQMVHFATGKVFLYLTFLGLFDLVIQLLIGLGMVIWLLEEERHRAALAAREVTHLAYHDALTGLPNRRMLLDRLEQAISQSKRDEEKVVVMYMDLDRFKVINDSLGHAVGDELLCAVATRLKHKTRAGDTVARLGGDEFALVFSRLHRAIDAVQIADNLLRTIRAPFSLVNRELFVSTSIGIAFYPEDGRDADTLLRNADIAMYRAKELGRNNYQLYVPSMNEQAVEKLELENELRRAITNRELSVHYQPIVDLSDEAIVGVEALVRWPHPVHGLVPPDRFLPIAEQLGLSDAIDDWVVPTACKQVREWQRRLGRPLRLAVNLSARPFQRPDLVFNLQQVLRETDFHARNLEIEITERIAMQNIEVGLDTLKQLRDLGVSVSIDDFGTGYSSLSYLRQFPVDRLKIDKSFVRDILADTTDRAIVTAMVPLAHSLGMQVVAEGVEQAEQRDFLRSLKCDLAQGYLFHKPLPPAELERLLGI
jgi:diguanylate cyclase (GGDEF)-like protein